GGSGLAGARASRKGSRLADLVVTGADRVLGSTGELSGREPREIGGGDARGAVVLAEPFGMQDEVVPPAAIASFSTSARLQVSGNSKSSIVADRRFGVEHLRCASPPRSNGIGAGRTCFAPPKRRGAIK